jgi:hypothetical protein
MRVTFEGESKHMDRAAVRVAAQFFGKCLIKPQMSSKVKINIVFCDLIKNNKNYGDACFTKSAWRPRDFEIRIEQRLRKKMLLRVLAHEMAHVQQWVSGRMIDLSDGSIRYAKKQYPSTWTKKEPWKLPWEKEAIMAEENLLEAYAKFKRLNP